MQTAFTGDVVNFNDPRPEEPGDVQHQPLDPER
jgi:peptide/nickel transport system permease protein